jgi:DNA replication protein DnaC
VNSQTKKSQEFGQKTKNSQGSTRNQIAFDFLSSIGREKIILNSPKYTEMLEKIAKDFDLIIKKHPTKGNRGYCKKCDTIATAISFCGNPVKCLCHHLTKKRDEEESAIKQQDKLKQIEHLRHLSLLSEKYKDVRWNVTKTGVNTSFDTAFNRCFRYSQIPDEVQKNGFGIFIWGDKGVGKTHLTAAVANSLLSKGIPVLFTNLYRISKAVKGTFAKGSEKTEQQLVDEFTNINFLVFDDLGSEVFTSKQEDNWLQGLLYDLINERYNSGKPTIFTSNYNLNGLITERKIMDKTIDRIQEMTKGAVIHIQGESRRSKYDGTPPF